MMIFAKKYEVLGAKRIAVLWIVGKICVPFGSFRFSKYQSLQDLLNGAIIFEKRMYLMCHVWRNMRKMEKIT